MILYKQRKELYRWLICNLRYYHCLISTFTIEPKQKKLHIDISNLILNRHLYNFLKYFDLNDYTVFLPRDKKIINELYIRKGEYKYISWLLDENILKFGNLKTRNYTLILTKDQLSNDYFFSGDNPNYFFVPMGQYPLNYKFKEVNNWKVINTRKQSIFMAGNLDRRFYYDMDYNPIFNMLSRRRIYDYLICRGILKKIESLYDLIQYIGGDEDNWVIIIDTQKDFSIEFRDLKKIISEFNFYLALPGTVIPFCHNLIEAMSVGCIPIIQSSYALSLHPQLENNKNALFFETLTDLDKLITKSFSLSDSELKYLQTNVLDYYNSNLIPKSIIQKIEKNNFTKIFIQGGQFSIEKATNRLGSN